MAETNDNFNFAFNRERLIIVGVVILIVWFSLLIFWFMKAEEISQDPCSICAKRMGEKVTCTLQNNNPLVPTPKRNYYPNYSIADVDTP